MRTLMAMIAAMLFAAPGFAAKPEDGQLGFQPAATPVMEQINSFHNQLLVIITVITIVVLALLAYVVFRYNKNAHSTPKKFSHNTAVEVIWTVVPVLILLYISVPSFKLLYYQDTIPEADMTIKAIGYQWYWEYEYPDHGDFAFASYMLQQDEVAERGLPADEYLLAVDAPVVVPEDTTVRVIVTAADVIHNWAMPAFGIKMDAIPGRLNETWFIVDEPGTYFGQCSELCGRLHAFMPIQVEVVPQDVFDAWTVAKQDGDDDAAAQVLASYKDDAGDAIRFAALQ